MKSKISILLLLLLASSLFSQSADMKIISSDVNSITIEYSPKLDTTHVYHNGNKYIQFNLDKVFESEVDKGSIGVLRRTILAGVPNEIGNFIEVINLSYKTVEGKLWSESFQNKTESVNPNFDVRKKNNLDEEVIRFGVFSEVRDLPVQSIYIHPVQINNKSNSIKFYDKIIFKLTYASQSNRSNFNINDNILSSLIVNYDQAKNWIYRKNKLNKVYQNSVLAEGDWFSFYVENEEDPSAPEEGIYKIDKQTLLTNGIDANSIDPRTIKIYNNGGKVLPEDLEIPIQNDLLENAILVVGEEDGVFDDSDYILFYARSNHFFDYDSTTGKVKRFFHPYSNYNLYFLTYGGAAGKRMQSVISSDQQTDNVVTSTKAFTAWEKDETKIMESGRLYMGDLLTEKSRTKTYMTQMPGYISGTQVNYSIDIANRAVGSVPFTLEESGTQIISRVLSGVGDLSDPFNFRARPYNLNGSYSNIVDNRSLLKFNYSASVSPSILFINYFEIEYERNLIANESKLTIYSDSLSGVNEYRLDGFTNNPNQLKIFDVTNNVNVNSITQFEISESRAVFKANESLNSKYKYIAVTPDAFKTPTGFSRIENSNLKGETQGAEFIIISHRNFIDEANRLKQHRESSSKNSLKTIVVDVQHIYNEFSNGIQDVSAIRNFIRHAYFNWNITPGYVLLFGDGNYDYKNIENVEPNFIIPYESYESYKYLSSYTSDDFYVNIFGDSKLDLTIGRINALTSEDAKTAVDKIIEYETSEIGDWRNLITLIADDNRVGQGALEPNLHTEQTEILSRNIPDYLNKNKIYSALYPTVFIGSGRRKPAVNEDIIKSANNGTLILNYIGHGNPEVWAHEYIFEKSVSIPQLNNEEYFFLTAATCDFGRYDVPGNQSAAEIMVLKENSGAIAAFTAARTVFSQDNARLNLLFFSNIFNRNEDGLYDRLGLAYLKTKVERRFGGSEFNDEKFHIYGDPTIRLNIPTLPVIIDSINGQDLSDDIQIKALSNVSIAGTVSNLDSTKNSSFAGEGVITLFDADKEIFIKEMSNYRVEFQGQSIYKGKVEISNGTFTTDFIVPKDISFDVKRGKLVAYINNNDNDGVGFTKNVLIGGIDTTKVNDGKGPIIEILFDNQQSGSNFIVDNSPLLKVKLSDETGINAAGSGIGHKLLGILNDDENNFIDLTDYYLADANSGGKSGEINYRFNDLENGEYKIKIKAFDVFNNAAESEVYFKVSDNSDLKVENVYNFPNPFSNITKFTFSRNQSGIPVDVKIKVYSVAGRLIKTIENFNVNDSYVQIDWDGRDEDGNLAANGVYLYKVIINTIDGSFKKEVLSKLAIIR